MVDSRCNSILNISSNDIYTCNNGYDDFNSLIKQRNTPNTNELPMLQPKQLEHIADVKEDAGIVDSIATGGEKEVSITPRLLESYNKCEKRKSSASPVGLSSQEEPTTSRRKSSTTRGSIPEFKLGLVCVDDIKESPIAVGGASPNDDNPTTLLSTSAVGSSSSVEQHILYAIDSMGRTASQPEDMVFHWLGDTTAVSNILNPTSIRIRDDQDVEHRRENEFHWESLKLAESSRTPMNIQQSAVLDHRHISFNEDEAFDWIIDNNYKSDIDSMGEILLNTSDLAIQMSADDIKSWSEQAQKSLDEKIPKVDQGADTIQINYAEVANNIVAMRRLRIIAYLDQAASSCRMNGQPKHRLYEFLEGYEVAETLVELLESGQRALMTKDFVANGEWQMEQSSSYFKAKELCHHAIAKLHKKGRVALLPWDDLSEDEKSFKY